MDLQFLEILMNFNELAYQMSAIVIELDKLIHVYNTEKSQEILNKICSYKDQLEIMQCKLSELTDEIKKTEFNNDGDVFKGFGDFNDFDGPGGLGGCGGPGGPSSCGFQARRGGNGYYR